MHGKVDKESRKCFAKKINISENKWFQKYKNISRNYPYHALLESGRGGKYSIIGLNPFAVLKGKDHRLTIFTNDKKEVLNGDPIDLMRNWMKQFRTAYNRDYPDFQGGAIGFFSYDCVRYIEEIPKTAIDDLGTPDLYFLVYDDAFVYDHDTNELWLITHDNETKMEEAEKKLLNLQQLWGNCEDAYSERTSIEHRIGKEESSFSMTEEEFKKAVLAVKDYIAGGDVFQVNLSVRQTQPLKTDPIEIYEALRNINPSPYMGYLHFPEFQVICGSPELLIKKKGSEVSTRPIAGTRSRGKDEVEDEQLVNELITNEKERAEHVMLVDLERNDLGRVCKFGTVETNEFMVIEKYSHVMHIVSNVRGEVAQDVDVFDVVKAAFPGGTITGAPKVRTMEIIEELEPVRRGLYTGSIGWISFYDDMELNIVIRTMLAMDGHAYVQAGAGIVIDSEPSAEYKESLKKAKALWKAKELSEVKKL